jgi:polyhydroxybutyrate depolymerase
MMKARVTSKKSAAAIMGAMILLAGCGQASEAEVVDNAEDGGMTSPEADMSSPTPDMNSNNAMVMEDMGGAQDMPDMMTSPPADMGTTPEEDMGPPVEGVGTPCAVEGEEGVCLETSDCAAPGMSFAGHCPGPAQVQCCIVEDTGPTNNNTTPSSNGCGKSTSDGSRSLMHDGRQREFDVRLPAGYDANNPTPVVLNFHGRNSSASQQVWISEMDSVADRENFIVVYPSGVASTWNADLCCGTAQTSNIDDVGFVSKMLDHLERDYCVDKKRVYSTGLSNGGFISHKIACELSDRIAAIAPVAGTLISPCEPSEPVSVMHFHGTSDALVSYEGYVGFAGVDDTIDVWRDKNNCSGDRTEVYEQGDVVCHQWAGCDQGTVVQRCRIDGGGHQWPGGFTIPGLGYNTDDIHASEAMWDFFKAHPKP